jgi:hypothetical protein
MMLVHDLGVQYWNDMKKNNFDIFFQVNENHISFLNVSPCGAMFFSYQILCSWGDDHP